MGTQETMSRLPGILNPAHPHFRFVFLFFLCFLTFGSYWCYDIPDAIQNQILARYDNQQTLYSLLYTIYNLSNIVIVLFGGYFIDVIGLRVGAILFCFLIALGQLVLSIGWSISNNTTAFVVMIIGRFIFSLGGESLGVAQSTFCSKWFGGKELALSFGITLSFARIGSAANLNITPFLLNKYGSDAAVYFGTLTCFVSLAMTVLACISDKVKDNYEKSKETEDEKKEVKVDFSWKDITHFPLSLWLIYFICVFYYIGVFTLISISGGPFFEARFGYNDDSSKSALSVPYTMSAVLAPFCGFMVDRVGRKPLFLTITSGILAGCFAILLLGPAYVTVDLHWTFNVVSILAMILMGFSYSLCAASLWPCVPLLVPDRLVGTAYAVMNSIQNGGLALASLVVGALHDTCAKHGGSADTCTARPLWFLFITCIVSTALCVWLNIVDMRGNRALTVTSKDQPAVVEEKQPLLVNGDVKRVD